MPSPSPTRLRTNRTWPTTPSSAPAYGSRTLRPSRSTYDPTVDIDHATQPDGDRTKTYYDLHGRRVLYPSHGVYVTQDGQKVFIK